MVKSAELHSFALFCHSKVVVYDTLIDLIHGDSEVLRITSLRLLGLLTQAVQQTSSPKGLQPPPGLWSRVTTPMGGSVFSLTT